jgi:hypothetical protein
MIKGRITLGGIGAWTPEEVGHPFCAGLQDLTEIVAHWNLLLGPATESKFWSQLRAGSLRSPPKTGRARPFRSALSSTTSASAVQAEKPNLPEVPM